MVAVIAGILAALGAAVSPVVAVGTFLADIALIPFKLAGDNKMLATFMYWIVFAVDAFIITPAVSSITEPFFAFFGIEGVKIGFTTIYLFLINIFTSFLFGWAFSAFHLLIITSLLLLLQLALFMHSHTKS